MRCRVDTLPAGSLQAALGLAGCAPSVHTSRPWRWRLDPGLVHLYSDPRRRLPAVPPTPRWSPDEALQRGRR